jgi:hypothetical protein
MLNTLKKKLGRGGGATSSPSAGASPASTTPSSDVALPRKERRYGVNPLPVVHKDALFLLRTPFG